MRISDWSSDVCSSDLAGAVHGARPRRGHGRRRGRPGFRLGEASGLADRQPAAGLLLPLGLGHRGPLPRAARMVRRGQLRGARSEEHTSELQSLMRISYAVFCLKKKITKTPLMQCLLLITTRIGTEYTNAQKIQTT